jgi:hypothetical protein
MNLHSLWDSGMISKQKMDYIQYAQYLQGHSFKSGFSPIEIPLDEIVDEDMAIRDQIYIFAAKDGPVILDQGYFARNLASMNSRLLLGGKRLAGVINKIFL